MTRLAWMLVSPESGKGQTVEFEIIGIFSGKKQEKFTACLLTSVKIKSLQTMTVAKPFWAIVEAQVSAARFYVENP
ncbi:hypothetical protein AK83_03275 [Streptococcus pneumoniae K2527]|nr:hypothetical protein AK83_03275 [Streptococcus pneumoniae K2527]